MTHSTSPSILITGATGTIGSELIRPILYIDVPPVHLRQTLQSVGFSEVLCGITGRFLPD